MRLAGIPAFLLASSLFTACLSDMDSKEDSLGISSGGNLDYYPGNEKSSGFTPNRFVRTSQDNLSTFGLDVDKAAYTFHRKKILQEGMLPDPKAIRTEEFLNWFGFSCAKGEGDEVFRIDVETAGAPWRDTVVGLRIGLEARDARPSDIPWNLTLLIDVSGSMTDRLDLVKKSLHRLVDAMRPGDRISIATYAGRISTVLEPTTLAQRDKATLKGIISDLSAGGGTAMADGLLNAYAVNRLGFIEGAVNRVIVCSDGDANIGLTGYQAMLARVKEYKQEGITLSTLGFGLGNYNDADMEMLADRGNGNYYYIDSEAEAARLFSGELTAMMQVVAWDAKIQVAFDPAAVKSYRLLGYENRAIADSAFRKDTTDAGELGAGHTVTALYELVLADAKAPLGTVHLRYKDSRGAMKSLSRDLGAHTGAAFSAASQDFRFAFSVAEYAEILRGSPYVRTRLSDLASAMRGMGTEAKRAEFLSLVDRAAGLSARR